MGKPWLPSSSFLFIFKHGSHPSVTSLQPCRSFSPVNRLTSFLPQGLCTCHPLYHVLHSTFSSYRPQHKVISSDMLPLTTFCSVPLPFSILLLYCFSFITLLIICNYLLLLNICDSHRMVSSTKVELAHSCIRTYHRVWLIERTQESLDTSMNGWIWAYLTERHFSLVAFLIAVGLDIITWQKDVRILEPLIHSTNV